MEIWLAVLIGSSLVSVSILILTGVLAKVSRHFDGVAHMFYAITTMQLRLELEDCGYEVPDWLKIMDADEEPLEMPPPTDLKLVKLEKDRKEKE